MRTRVAVGVWTLALVVAVSALVLILSTDHPDEFTARAVLTTAVGVAFVAAGLVARYRRPDNRTGLVMVATGFAWFVPSLTQANDAIPFSLGTALGDLPWAFFAYLILSYPHGRLEDAASKAVVAGAFAIAGVLRPVWTLFNDLREEHENGPENALLIDHRPGLADGIELAERVIALFLIAGAVTILARRWRRATPPVRRALSPVFLAFTATVVILAISLFLEALGLDGEYVYWVSLVALLSVPLAFAIGLLRTRLARAGLGDLLIGLQDAGRAGNLRDALARTLGDPSLEIGYWLPDQETFVDGRGNPVELPPPGSGRHATVVERRGRRVAVLVHDASLLDDPGFVSAVGAAAGLALENEQRMTQLAESEARHRAFVNALPDLIFRMSRDGTYLDWNGSERDLVLPPEQLLGSKVGDVLPPDVAEPLLRCMERLQPGHVETLEYQLRIGPLNRHFEARVAAVSDDEVGLIVRDISDRKRTEAQLQRLQDELHARLDELRRERDFIQAVVQAAPSLFCLVDPQGRIIRYNRSLELATGLEDDGQVRGRPFWEVFIAPEQAEEVKTNFLDRPGENETEWVRADGQRFIVAWRVTPLVDEHGEPRFLITGMNITERKQQEEELRSSRARIVEAGDVERRRLERNLHDGAQQRLVSISLFLRLAQGKVRTDLDGAEELLARAGDELALALEELRELARGIHPAVLTDRGLEPALQTLITRSPVPTTLAEAPDERLPEPVEAAAYYVVAEALTNVAKYAQASAATVRIARSNGRAIVEVADDGVGGADPTLGSGLRGLADRVEALDGLLAVESAPGSGTIVRAEIPV